MPWPPFTGRKPASYHPQLSKETEQKLSSAGRPGPQGSAPRHQTGEAVGRAKPVWAPSVKALIPGARPSPAFPALRAGPRAAGPQRGREALVSVHPLPTGFVPLGLIACPQPAAQVRLNRVREPHSQRHPQPWSEPQLKSEPPGLRGGGKPAPERVRTGAPPAPATTPAQLPPPGAGGDLDPGRRPSPPWVSF